MSELELHQPASSLVAWAEEAKAAHALATSICSTSFAGAYKGKPQDATAAILKGAEIGLTPLASISAIHLIQGTPALSAMALRALVQSQGHHIWIEKSTDKECVAKGRRKDDPADVEHVSRWTIARAERLGLTGKDNWRRQPEAMLIARATSEIARMVAADALLGIGYSVEELTDEAPAAPARTVQRAVKAAPPHATTSAIAEDVHLPELPAVEPEAEAVAVVEEKLGGEVIDDGTPADVMSQAQRAKLHAAYRDAGITDRAKKLNYAIAVIGRDIASSAELTKAEAGDVIDALEQESKA
jgi:hypothetical protein